MCVGGGGGFAGLMSCVSWFYFQCLIMRSNTLNFKSTPQQNLLVLFSLCVRASSVLQTKAKEDSRESFKGQGTKCVKGHILSTLRHFQYFDNTTRQTKRVPGKKGNVREDLCPQRYVTLRSRGGNRFCLQRDISTL